MIFEKGERVRNSKEKSTFYGISGTVGSMIKNSKTGVSWYVVIGDDGKRYSFREDCLERVSDD